MCTELVLHYFGIPRSIGQASSSSIELFWVVLHRLALLVPWLTSCSAKVGEPRRFRNVKTSNSVPTTWQT
jgi:hypothetical protein